MISEVPDYWFSNLGRSALDQTGFDGLSRMFVALWNKQKHSVDHK